MFFLVDLENVHNPGLSGADQLCAEDSLILFFSESSRNIERRYLTEIENADCQLETYKLKTTGKNALDFYIAVRVGEILCAAPDASIGIISKDKGYKAVCEFVRMRGKSVGCVVKSTTIEGAILAADEANHRTKRIQRQVQTENIESFYAAHQERMRIRSRLREQFAGTEYEHMLADILSIVFGKEHSPKVIYLDSLRHFGRKNGTEIYRRLKDCAIF